MGVIATAVVFWGLSISLLLAQTPKSVEPTAAKPGQQIVLHGDDLGRKKVKAVYVSDQDRDYKASIVKQNDNDITFTIPSVKPGEYGISLQRSDNENVLFSFPAVKLRVEP